MKKNDAFRIFRNRTIITIASRQTETNDDSLSNNHHHQNWAKEIIFVHQQFWCRFFSSRKTCVWINTPFDNTVDLCALVRWFAKELIRAVHAQKRLNFNSWTFRNLHVHLWSEKPIEAIKAGCCQSLWRDITLHLDRFTFFGWFHIRTVCVCVFMLTVWRTNLENEPH